MVARGLARFDQHGVTGGIVAEVTAWQSRPLEPLYPVVFFDGAAKPFASCHVGYRVEPIAATPTA